MMLSAFSYYHYIHDYIKKSVFVLKRYLRQCYYFFIVQQLGEGICISIVNANMKAANFKILIFFIRIPQFSQNRNIHFFSDLSLNTFLKYSCFRRGALLLTVSEKFQTRKSCISSKIKHTWNKAKGIFVRKKENDTAELDEISFYKKNVFVKMGTYKLTDKMFPRYKN